MYLEHVRGEFSKKREKRDPGIIPPYIIDETSEHRARFPPEISCVRYGGIGRGTRQFPWNLTRKISLVVGHHVISDCTFNLAVSIP